MTAPKVIFVYNANSDLFSTITDFAHKIFSPSSYQCHLCALTYGNFLIKQEWKSFIESLAVETVFLHTNEFEKQYGTTSALPAVFILTDGVIKEIITKQEIDNCQSLEELKILVTKKLKERV